MEIYRDDRRRTAVKKQFAVHAVTISSVEESFQASTVRSVDLITSSETRKELEYQAEGAANEVRLRFGLLSKRSVCSIRRVLMCWKRTFLSKGGMKS